LGRVANSPVLPGDVPALAGEHLLDFSSQAEGFEGGLGGRCQGVRCKGVRWHGRSVKCHVGGGPHPCSLCHRRERGSLRGEAGGEEEAEGEEQGEGPCEAGHGETP
jgi:hypothetical protein